MRIGTHHHSVAFPAAAAQLLSLDFTMLDYSPQYRWACMVEIQKEYGFTRLLSEPGDGAERIFQESGGRSSGMASFANRSEESIESGSHQVMRSPI